MSMSTQGPSAQLNGSTFGLTVPINLIGWIVFVLGIIVFVIGLMIPMLLIAAIGILMIGFSCPTQLQVKMHNIRKQMRPSEVAWQKEMGGTQLVSFWNNETIERPEIDMRSWLFPPPAMDEWHLDSRYSADKDGQLIADHPNKIGTPNPATFSNAGLATLGAFCLISVQLMQMQKAQVGQFNLIYFSVAMAVIWLVVGAFSWKRHQLMLDTATSNIRSVAVGNVELVGQVRNGPINPSLLHVDGDHSKSVADLVSWKWDYEVEVETTRMVVDSKGNRRRQVSRHWRTIRHDQGGVDFTLHDGTGGILVIANSFDNRNFGDHLIQWQCRHHNNLGQFFGNIFTMMVSNEKILRHRWTLWGLKIGDPCYLLAMVKPRTNEEMESDCQVDKTLQNSIIYAIGEDSPAFDTRLEKGTELTAMSEIKSQIETLVFPVFGIIIAISMIAI